MRFLLIDADAGYRQVLRYHLTAAWPDAAIVEHEPVAGTTFILPPGLRDYDAILLGYPASADEGRSWLDQLKAGSSAPVIVFADRGDEFLAVDTLKAGAESYFPKARVRHERLTATIRGALNGARRPATELAMLDSVSAGSQVFDIVRELHATKFASVYLAQERGTRADVALKLIRYVPDKGGENLFERFLQEYEIVARIEHPNVVRILEMGVADDHAFIAMEYLGGGSLAERINTPLPEAFALGCARQIAAALSSLHEADILHRDLKPANIMFRDQATLALIDFGLAKQQELGAALTGDGQIFGTPYYMSPEQGHAERTDSRSDLYSLGCVLFEMLTGRRPFVAPTAMGVIYKHAHAERPQLGGGLARWQPVLDRLLAPARDDRFESADALLAALERL